MATWSVACNPVTAQQKAKLRGVRGCRAERLAGWLTLFQQRIASCQSWRCHLDRNPVPDTTPITNLSVTQGHTHLRIHMFSIKKEPYQWKHMYSVGAMGGREKMRKNGEKEYTLSFINTNTVESPNNDHCLCAYPYHLCLTNLDLHTGLIGQMEELFDSSWRPSFISFQ